MDVCDVSETGPRNGVYDCVQTVVAVQRIQTVHLLYGGVDYLRPRLGFFFLFERSSDRDSVM